MTAYYLMYLMGEFEGLEAFVEALTPEEAIKHLYNDCGMELGIDYYLDTEPYTEEYAFATECDIY